MANEIVERIRIIDRIPTELVGSLMASTTLLKIESKRLKAAGKNAEAKAIDVQLEVNDDILNRHSVAAGFGEYDIGWTEGK